MLHKETGSKRRYTEFTLEVEEDRECKNYAKKAIDWSAEWIQVEKIYVLSKINVPTASYTPVSHRPRFKKIRKMIIKKGKEENLSGCVCVVQQWPRAAWKFSHNPSPVILTPFALPNSLLCVISSFSVFPLRKAQRNQNKLGASQCPYWKTYCTEGKEPGMEICSKRKILLKECDE
jgi:hypothetical protein